MFVGFLYSPPGCAYAKNYINNMIIAHNQEQSPTEKVIPESYYYYHNH
jgi:hypothetical protein